MAYYRFETLDQVVTNPHLSTGKGGIVKGHMMTLRNNNKIAGTGSQLHFHPNELIVFSLVGKLNCIVGNDRRIVRPGTVVHMPPYARHSIMATEDGDVSYLYLKDNTWDLTGFSADGKNTHGTGAAIQAERDAIVDGLDTCFYPMIDGLDAPAASARRVCRVEGQRLAFTFNEAPEGWSEDVTAAPREMFAYIIRGEMQTSVGGEEKAATNGEILHIAKGDAVSLRVTKGPARWATYEPTARLEKEIAEQGAHAPGRA